MNDTKLAARAVVSLRFQPYDSWVLIQLRCWGRQIARGHRSLPSKDAASFVSYYSHDPTDLQQTHRGRHIDDKNDQTRQHEQNPERDSQAQHRCPGRRTLHNNDDDRVRERGEEQPKRKFRDARPYKRPDHPRRQLGARQLESHECDREDNSNEGQHRCGDNAQKRFS
jgi:hypothetical protein